MARKFAPALRRSSIDPRLAELKSLTVMGPGIIPATVSIGNSSIARAAGWNLEAVIQDAYERSVWVFKSTELYAKHAGRLPILAEQDDESYDNHPLIRALNKQANPHETGRQFKTRLASLLLLSKVGVFVEITRSRAGAITRLDLMPPDRVRIIPDPHGDYVDYFEFTRPDGEVRNLPPERVLWIRDPHPTDPFSGVTPLEAAGVSIELDHLARVYNTSFIKRDARPGGIIGVDTDTLDDRELDRIEKVFKPGAHHAGKITAIGTGPGGLTYIDTSARPRDMAYEHTSEKAKAEVLASFGVPESLLGQTAGRTYDNASQDEENWARFQLLPFLEIITDAFTKLLDPDIELRYDTSSIEALELPKKRARAEAREEWNAGLRSAKEYRELRPELEEIDNAHTRALWFAPSKAPVPARPEDAAELGMETPGADAGAPPPATAGDVVAETELLDAAAAGAPGEGGPIPITPAGEPPAPAPEAAVDPVLGAAGAATELLPPVPGADQAGVSAATGVVDEAMTGTMSGDYDPAAADGGSVADEEDLEDLLEGKGIEIAPGIFLTDMQVKTAANPDRSAYSPPEEELRRLELATKAALDALVARQVGVIKARLESPKMRRGTRFWTPTSAEDTRAGDAPIDTARVLAADRWIREAGETVAPIVQPAAEDAALGILTALAASGALVAPPAVVAEVAGLTREAAALPPEVLATAAGRAAALAALGAVVVAEAAMTEWLADMSVAMDAHLVQAQPNMTELLGWLEEMWAKKGRHLADSVALSVAQTALGQAREEAAEALLPLPTPERPEPGQVRRSWTTRGDERVRAAHAAAAGQERGVGEPFDIAGYDVRFPSDPLAPAPVARGCRCWVTYTWPKGAQFTLGI